MIKLECRYEEYERYNGGRYRKVVGEGETLKEALLNVLDQMNVYTSSEDVQEIEEEEGREITFEEILEEIEMSNGDGCDFILELSNPETNETYIMED